MLKKPALAPWSFTKWLTRVTLWLLIWPVGLWRSIRHGRKRRDAELVAQFKKAA